MLFGASEGRGLSPAFHERATTLFHQPPRTFTLSPTGTTPPTLILQNVDRRSAEVADLPTLPEPATRSHVPRPDRKWAPRGRLLRVLRFTITRGKITEIDIIADRGRLRAPLPGGPQTTDIST